MTQHSGSRGIDSETLGMGGSSDSFAALIRLCVSRMDTI